MVNIELVLQNVGNGFERFKMACLPLPGIDCIVAHPLFAILVEGENLMGLKQGPCMQTTQHANGTNHTVLPRLTIFF